MTLEWEILIPLLRLEVLYKILCLFSFHKRFHTFSAICADRRISRLRLGHLIE